MKSTLDLEPKSIGSNPVLTVCSLGGTGQLVLELT